jgi:hypothetical protein
VLHINIFSLVINSVENMAQEESFIDKIRMYEERTGRKAIRISKEPPYALYEVDDSFIIFDGENEFQLSKMKVYEIGKDQYLLWNHRDIRNIVGPFDYSSLSKEELIVVSRYAPLLEDLAIEIALQKRIPRISMEEMKDPTLLEEKIKSDEWTRKILSLFFRKMLTPLPRTLEERQYFEREYDVLILEAFGLKKL